MLATIVMGTKPTRNNEKYISGNLRLGACMMYAGFHTTKPVHDCYNFRRAAEKAFDIKLKPSDLLVEVAVSSPTLPNWAFYQHPKLNDDCFFPEFVPLKFIRSSRTGDVVEIPVFNRIARLTCCATTDGFEDRRNAMLEEFQRRPTFDSRDKNMLIQKGILVLPTGTSG